MAAAKQQEIAAYEAWQCELYGDGAGCAGASNRPGPGPIAHAKQQTYEQDPEHLQLAEWPVADGRAEREQAEGSLKQAQGAALARYQAGGTPRRCPASSSSTTR